MKKFKFELEDLLKLRQFEQEQAQIELGKAVAVENNIQAQLDALAQEYSAVKASSKGSLDFSQITSTSKFYSYMNIKSERLMNEMAQAKLVTEEKRKIFFAALQKTESLSKLKEKMYEEYKAQTAIAEEDEIDDIITSHTNAVRAQK